MSLSAGAFLWVVAGAAPAHALTILQSPFGPNAAVEVFIGSYTTAPGQAAVFRRW